MQLQFLACEPSGPLQHSKSPPTPNLSSICPNDCFSGFQSVSKFVQKIEQRRFPDKFSKFRQILTHLGPLELQVVFPLEGPESHRGGNLREMGKNYEIPLSSATPENGEKLQKNYKNCIFGVIFTPFLGQFSPFSGVGPGRGICNFSPFFGDFRPGGFPGPLRGKTTRNPWAEPWKSGKLFDKFGVWGLSECCKGPEGSRFLALGQACLHAAELS